MSDSALSLGNFDGSARLFPLPNLVLFPCVVQPLHIFEPRYRQMLADALASDRLLALVLLKPGWEEEYHLQPAIESVACLGKVFKEERLPDGRYNLLLHGLHRVRLLEEVPTTKLYRTARVELLGDHTALAAPAAEDLRRQIGEVVPAWLTAHGSSAQQIQNMLHSDLSLATLTDIFSFSLPLDIRVKQQLLEELSIEHRAELLLKHLRAQIKTQQAERAFPPRFSPN